MANTDAPRGLRPVRMLDGTPWNGAVERCAVAAADTGDIFIGTPVKLAAAGLSFTDYSDPNQGGSFVGVTTSDTTEVVYGVVVAIETDRANLAATAIDGSAVVADRQVMVAIATPNTVFEVQSSATPGLAAIGSFVDHSTESADASAVSISNVEIGTTAAGGSWRLIGYVNRPDNDPTLANPDCLVVAVESEVGVAALTVAV